MSELSPERFEAICRVVHEAMGAWRTGTGEEPLPPWDDAPESMRAATEAAVRFRLEHPDAPASAQHAQWMAEKRAAGWRYGAARSDADKIHPMLVDFEDLPEHEIKKDALVAAVVRALAG